MEKDRQRLILYSTPQKPFQKEAQPEMFVPQIRRRRLTGGERLLRDSAIACALLLGILSLRNIDRPWAQTASRTVEKALTADFDVDETLGELQFVRNFLPESALVFWNVSGADRLLRPVEGAMLHEYTAQQPWYTFSAVHGEEVVCGKSGMLSGAAQTDEGDWALEIEHADGSSTVYAYLDRGTLEIGESVSKGEVLSAAALQGCIYVEYRRDGAPLAVDAFLP